MLTVHHLGVSQSERVVWLCEELEIPYELKRYDRDRGAAPPEYKALHPAGVAPVITDGDFTLGETGAIFEYVIARYGQGRLAPAPEDPMFADYLYWFHFANSSAPLNNMVDILIHRFKVAEDSDAVRGLATRRGGQTFALAERRLGESAYFAGEGFTAADIMMTFPLTTMRMLGRRDLSPYPHIRAYLQRIGERPAYRRAMEKGDPGLARMLT
jgi:glutathione S-transferase